MYDFGLSLTILPAKFAPCRFEKFAHRGYFCAVFEKNFIFLPLVTQKPRGRRLRTMPSYPRIRWRPALLPANGKTCG
jgi:hypothetical protein